MNCDQCKNQDKKGRLRHYTGMGFLCSECEPYVEIKKGSYSFQEKVYLKNYGMVSKARIDELNRRKILPIKRNDGKSEYYLGRIGENGKIQEKHPNYYK